MAELRKRWQEFKKKYPSFEKSKNFKADAGPLMDEYSKKSLQCIDLAKKIEEDIKALEPREDKISDVLDMYGHLIDLNYKKIAEEYQYMPGEFKALKGLVKDQESKFRSAIKRLAKEAQKYVRASDEW